jgi:predicted RNA-binding protein with PUA-like domain
MVDHPDGSAARWPYAVAKMARQHWLIKSEPDKYPFEKLVADGHTVWDGIRSFEARNNLRAMVAGDPCLFYHSNEGKAVVGVARVSRAAYPDPSSDDGEWSAVDVEPVRALKRPVTLAELREHEVTGKMMMMRRPRLSVVPVTKEEFDAVLALSRSSA